MKKSNQPAFPVSVAVNEVGIYSSFDANGGENLIGLTKREYFAAMAMQGFAANSHDSMFMSKNDDLAKFSVQLADALLAELEK